MNIFTRIGNWLCDSALVMAHEFRSIWHDGGALLFFFALPLFYPIIYTLIYNPEVVREIPVAVVDDSRTADSRHLVEMASASPAIKIYDYCADMGEAKHLMASGDVFGVMYIPRRYAVDLATGSKADVEFYCDMSLLLRYRTLMAALTDLQIQLAGEIGEAHVSDAGLGSFVTGESILPIESHSNFLGDVEQGFASFVIPGIVVLILQQSMLLGIALLGGSERERRRRNGGLDPRGIDGVGAAATVWGKAMCYVSIYLASTIYCLHFVPEFFNLPHSGSPADYLLFMFPELLAAAFLGQALLVVMRERESCFMIMVISSVLFLFLSGLTWPRYAMPDFWLWLGDIVPSTWAVEGFVQINSNNATLAEVSRPYSMLWILAAVYMVVAIIVTRYLTQGRSGRPSLYGRN